MVNPSPMVMEIRYDPALVTLSVLVAILASYVALGLANRITQARGHARTVWLSFGALAMGIGIWSMHFVGMLASEMPGMAMAYDIPLMILSILIAIGASAVALYVVSRPKVFVISVVIGGTFMAGAIAGMHYVGMFSMRMAATIQWNALLVTLSILIALVASFVALLVSIRLRDDSEGHWRQLIASAIMGVAIAGMHYTGMAAATFIHSDTTYSLGSEPLANSSGLTVAVLSTTLAILGLALGSSIMDRALSRRTKVANENAQLYREAKEAVHSLHEERELRQRFVSAMAHDLRNPLAAATMSMQLCVRQPTNPEGVEKLGRKAIDSLQRMEQMIEDLLDAHRISAGQSLPLQREACRLKEFLQSTIEDLITVHGNRFVLRTNLEIQGNWDCKYLRRAVENLCTNAVKYGKEDKPIFIGAKLSPDGKIATVSVTNEGEPLSVDEKNKLFSLFSRGKKAEKSGKQGWGLGLTIVRGIVEAHGGSVTVESAAGAGTTFFMHLPIAKA